MNCPECNRLEDEYLGPERVAVRNAYRAAYKSANNVKVAPRLSYGHGWWQIWTLNGFRDRRVRQAEIIRMTAVLVARAQRETVKEG